MDKNFLNLISYIKKKFPFMLDFIHNLKEEHLLFCYDNKATALINPNKEIKDYIKLLKNNVTNLEIKSNIKLPKNSFFLTISFSEDYNNVKLKISKYLSICKDEEGISLYPYFNKDNCLLIENSIENIYCYNTKRNIKYKATLKTVSSLGLFDFIIQFINSNICKEMKGVDVFDLNIAMQNLKCNTKQELLRLHFPKLANIITKRFNKINLRVAYYILKTQHLLSNKDLQTLINNAAKLNPKKINEERDTIKQFFIFKNSSLSSNHYSMLLDDYIYMCVKAKQKVRLTIKSIKRLEKEHDNLVKGLLAKNEKRKGKIILNKEDPFANLILPPSFERIKTKERLHLESVIQRNCVYSYLERISKGECSIFSLVYQDKRYTINIMKSKKNFFVREIKGVCNQEAPKEVINFVNDLVV